MNSSVRGEYLDSEGADDFFAMAAELDVPVFLHPGAEPVGSDSVGDFRLVEQVSRFFDVAVSLATLVVSGRLEQYPELKVIAATAGGGSRPSSTGSTWHSARGLPGRGRPRRALAEPERLPAERL